MSLLQTNSHTDITDIDDVSQKDVLMTTKPLLVCNLCKHTATPMNKCEHSVQLGSSFQLTQKYNDILEKYFQITLDKMLKQSKSFRSNIENTEVQFVNYYNKIRNEIETCVENLLKDIQSEKNNLLSEIDMHQQECQTKFQNQVKYKNEIQNFLKEVDTFSKELPLQTKDNKFKLELFKKAYFYKIEIERKKIEYESFIFNNKIQFCSSEPQTKRLQNIGYLCHISDRLPTFDHWLQIDLKRTLYLNNMRGENAIDSPRLIVEQFSRSLNLFVCFVSNNPNLFNVSKIKLVVTEPNGNYLRSINEETLHNQFNVYKFKDLILLSTYTPIGYSNLKIFNENLDRVMHVEALALKMPLSCLYANQNYIYMAFSLSDKQDSTEISLNDDETYFYKVVNGEEGSMTKTKGSVLYAMNWQLEYVNTTQLNFQQKNTTKTDSQIQETIKFPYYFSHNVDQIERYDSKLYLKYKNTLTVVNEETENGEIMKVLDIPCASDLSIDMSGFFVLFCHTQKKLFYLNLNCDVLDEDELFGWPHSTKLKFYYNAYERTMIFYDEKEYVLYIIKENEKTTTLFKNSIHWYLEVNAI